LNKSRPEKKKKAMLTASSSFAQRRPHKPTSYNLKYIEDSIQSLSMVDVNPILV